MATGRAARWVLGILLVGVLAASATQVAITSGNVDGRGFAGTLADALPALVIALVVAALVLAASRAAAATARRRGSPQSARGVAKLETVALAVVVVILLASLFGNATGAIVSVGLVGFGLTLALQRPILALAGWATIFFGRLFREGDRIEVMGMVGDVLGVQLFTTRLWEIGTSSSPLPNGGASSPLRPTGRIVTVSNAVFVEHPVANATSDIGFVFDEFAVTIAYEADRALARRLLEETAASVLDLTVHERAAREYEALTVGMPMEKAFPREPVVIQSLQESWIELRLRYLVDARGRARVRTELGEAWLAATAAHANALPNVFARAQHQAVGADGRPKN